jgi:hypothetical protein
MIRPEAAALLHRWREVIAGLALAVLGLWTALSPAVLIKGLGGVIGVAGLALAVVGLRRARFTARGTGPGIVQLVEGQISYFGPESGGFMALDDLAEIALGADGDAWLLRDIRGQRLSIPRAATGADGLFDAFARLDGLDMPSLLRLIDGAAPATTPRTVWRRKLNRLLT